MEKNWRLILSKILSESYGDDTEFEKGGLLLLSYPVIEIFVSTDFLEDTNRIMFKLVSDVKSCMGLEGNQSNLDLDNISKLNKKIEMEDADFV